MVLVLNVSYGVVFVDEVVIAKMTFVIIVDDTLILIIKIVSIHFHAFFISIGILHVEVLFTSVLGEVAFA